MIWNRQKAAPRVTITLHESVGPATVAAVLHHAGIKFPRPTRWQRFVSWLRS